MPIFNNSTNALSLLIADRKVLALRIQGIEEFEEKDVRIPGDHEKSDILII